MAILCTDRVAIRGISACVPSKIENTDKVYSKWGGGEQFASTVGVKQKRKASTHTTSADLCQAAAERLIQEMAWDKSEIEILVFVSQTPDYQLPATSCILQQRLGLPQSCMTIDISLGCSGWVYALSVIASLMECSQIKKGLLLAGDTLSKICSAYDKSTYPIFGDAGTCTAIERNDSSQKMTFVMHTDGSGHDAIICRDGGSKHPVSSESLLEKDIADGIKRNPMQLAMDGMSVFTFGISKAPKAVNELLAVTGVCAEEIDMFTFHQANLFMNEKIRKKLKLATEQVPYSLDEFGNTSSASIPLTMVTRCAEDLRTKKLKHVACGFGVGLSWGAVRFDTDRIAIPALVEIP